MDVVREPLLQPSIRRVQLVPDILQCRQRGCRTCRMRPYRTFQSQSASPAHVFVVATHARTMQPVVRESLRVEIGADSRAGEAEPQVEVGVTAKRGIEPTALLEHLTPDHDGMRRKITS